MRCPNISGRVQSGLISTNSCTAACEAKFSMSVTLDPARRCWACEYHGSLEGMKRNLSEYFRITRSKLDVYAYFEGRLAIGHRIWA